ncbi:type VI secretion system baseplate subunit TssK [Paraburkholderia caffeinilytica]|uniref:type VI secretion system baseplate subunit TssK n=1 Tax=Paraburkholderia caffeinilytica TaxID=1761016 RepID=UPI003DA15DD3
MSWNNKVVWSEGLFLRPQLFQQQERYLERYVHTRALALSPFFFGLSQYRIDTDALAIGKIILSSASGVFPDGTPFDAPADTPPPPPLAIRSTHLDQVIYLATPARIPNVEETTFRDAPDSCARYAVFEEEVRDSNSTGQGPRLIQLSRIRLRLITEDELGDSWLSLALARIKAIRPDNMVQLDDALIPPVTGYGVSPLLNAWLVRIHELTGMRANALSERLTGPGSRLAKTAEVSDYLLLQTLNRYEPRLRHLRTVPTASPEWLYEVLVEMMGELSTWLRTDTRRPIDTYLPYQHGTPHLCLKPIVEDIQRLLNLVLVRSAQAITLVDLGHGMRNAALDPAEIAGFSTLVFAIQADMAPETLMQQFIVQAKAGPSEKLPDLVRGHLPGIPLQMLPVPPRQIPFSAGHLYFEITRAGRLWDEVAQHGGLALHVAGEFPGLNLQLWGIRA